MKEYERRWLLRIIAINLALSAMVGYAAVTTAQEEKKVFFTIHLMVPKGNVNRENVAMLLAEELPKIGIGVEVHIIDFSEWLKRVYQWPKTWEEGGYDMFLVQYGYGTDPDGMKIFFHSESMYPNGLNIVGYMNPKVDKLLEEGAKELDPEKRKLIYMNVSKYLYEDLPVIPYWRIVNTFILRKEVEGFNPITDTDTCYNWYIPGKDEIRYVQPTDAKTLNPIFTTDGYSFRAVGDPCYDGLVAINENYEPVPAVAESWEWINDTFIVFHLRRDVYWHDGVQVTAEDVKFTYDAILDPDTGAVDYKTFSDVIEEVIVLDDFTVAFRLKHPYAPFLTNIATTGLVPKHVLEDVPHSEWRHHWTNTGVDKDGTPRMPIGCGPYRMVEWKRDQYIKLEAFDKYYRGKPKTRVIYMMVIPDAATAFAAIKKGEVDILNDWFGWTPKDIQAAQEDPDLKTVSYRILGPQLIGINLAHPILQNKYVRWAINYMIPREHIVKNILGGVGGEPAYQFLAPETIGHNPDLPPVPYDPEKAKEMMEKAGYKYEWLEEKPLPMWVYVAPPATFIVGMGIGLALMKVIYSRREAVEAASSQGG
ncbi:MAG: hypothetical protein J7M38_12215 [Armatimonadetes bacterium]|nr:hypothetical protein [Armatimonadota bacterium]